MNSVQLMLNDLVIRMFWSDLPLSAHRWPVKSLGQSINNRQGSASKAFPVSVLARTAIDRRLFGILCIFSNFFHPEGFVISAQKFTGLLS